MKKQRVISPWQPDFPNNHYFRIPVTKRYSVFGIYNDEPETYYQYSEIQLINVDGTWYIDEFPDWLTLGEVNDILLQKVGLIY